MFVLVVIALLIVGAVYGMGTDSIDRHTVKSLDINRYMGDWYEIARYDHPFERGLVEVKATYRMAADGRIEVVNCGIDYRTERSRVAHGRAKLTPIQGKLRVSFFWFFYSDYNVMSWTGITAGQWSEAARTSTCGFSRATPCCRDARSTIFYNSWSGGATAPAGCFSSNSNVAPEMGTQGAVIRFRAGSSGRE